MAMLALAIPLLSGCIVYPLNYHTNYFVSTALSMTPQSSIDDVYTVTYLEPDIATISSFAPLGDAVKITYNGIEDFTVQPNAFGALSPYEFWAPYTTPYLIISEEDDVGINPEYLHPQAAYELHVHPATCQLASGSPCAIDNPLDILRYDFETNSAVGDPPRFPSAHAHAVKLSYLSVR